METLLIQGVDLDLLEQQRRALTRVLHRLSLAFALPEDEAKDYDTLLGLENMLDEWSDQRYFTEVKK